MPIVDDYRALIANHDRSNASWNAAEALQFPTFVSYSFYETNNLPTTSQMPYDAATTRVFTPAERDPFVSPWMCSKRWPGSGSLKPRAMQ